jgi:hypothetical protein
MHGWWKALPKRLEDRLKKWKPVQPGSHVAEACQGPGNSQSKIVDNFRPSREADAIDEAGSPRDHSTSI